MVKVPLHEVLGLGFIGFGVKGVGSWGLGVWGWVWIGRLRWWLDPATSTNPHD